MPRKANKSGTMPTFTIIVDTREQRPYKFRGINPVIQYSVDRSTLQTGDYSVATDLITLPEDKIVVERKSLADLYGSIGQNRYRFEAEFKRMAAFGFAAVVVEADWAAIRFPNRHLKHPTKMDPKSLIATMIAWQQRYGVHWFTCPNRQFAEQLTYRLLERWARDHKQCQ